MYVFSLKTQQHNLCSTKCISEPSFHLKRWLDQLPTSFQKLPEMLTELGVCWRNSKKKIESEKLEDTAELYISSDFHLSHASLLYIIKANSFD